ncbi:uracil-DNA glycosylase [Mycoplasma sp. 3341]|uniref:uracil-DNA glycosylase n=1 Tax=Mycoplasma sp. 3341 TaxID=3447506 RepID=UPI003F6557D2
MSNKTFSFNDFLEQEQKQEYFVKIANNLNQIEDEKLAPSKDNIFKCFDLDFENLKVIILGQDPYFTKGVADGLAFSSSSNKRPPSLNNIFKEIKNSYPDSAFLTNNLINWRNQGVLLLNTTLTAEIGKALSHKDWNWNIFTAKTLSEICKRHKNLVFLVFGNYAKNFLIKNNLILKDNFYLFTSHPSGLSAYRGFLGSNVFKKCNDILTSLNKTTIDWSTK